MIDWLIVGGLASISKPSMYMKTENEFNRINKIYTSGWGKQTAGEREQLPWNLFFLTNKHTRISNCLRYSISFPIVFCPFLSYTMNWSCTKYRTERKYKLHCYSYKLHLLSMIYFLSHFRFTYWKHIRKKVDWWKHSEYNTFNPRNTPLTTTLKEEKDFKK